MTELNKISFEFTDRCMIKKIIHKDIIKGREIIITETKRIPPESDDLNWMKDMDVKWNCGYIQVTKDEYDRYDFIGSNIIRVFGEITFQEIVDGKYFIGFSTPSSYDGKTKELDFLINECKNTVEQLNNLDKN